MKKIMLIAFVLIAIVSHSQNPYAVTAKVKEKSEQSQTKPQSNIVAKFPYIRMQEWHKGMKFMYAPDKYGYLTDGKYLPLQPYKGEWWEKIEAKDFEYKIFSFDTITTVNNKKVVILNCDGKKYQHSLMTVSDINERIDCLVYVDEIDILKQDLIGKILYILTEDWFRENSKGESERQSDGIRFEKVSITNIGFGTKNNPIRIVFKPSNKEEAFIDINTLSGINELNLEHSSIIRDDFDECFSEINPKTKYPKISAEMWSLIQRGKVKLGMSKEEATLSWGEPNDINTDTFNGGKREQWVYGTSSYLYFINSKLTHIQN